MSFICVPLLFQCTHARIENNSPFAYKEIYLPSAIGEHAEATGLNSVDVDWGLWGHNLRKVLPKDVSMLVFASIGGQRTTEQFCFSSDKLYEYIEDYIEEEFGERDCHRFAILPNDNRLVCQCTACLRAGNDEKNATPAVVGMIERLAKRFPNHLFFTSSYLTTAKVPDHVLPQNAGVLVSAIDYLLSPGVTSYETAFERLLQQWNSKVEHLYVWDYINNFDDYFTPFPIFKVMQRRLQLYVRNDVDGIFLNGSGTDYSTFEHLRTLVLNDLLIQPDTNVEQLIEQHCTECYPVTGKMIAQFLLFQEEWTQQKGEMLPIYEGVKKAKETYLPAQEFIAFYDKLEAQIPNLSGQEKTDVERLCKAMALTRLELMRIDGNIKGYQPLLKKLSELHQEGVDIYSESCWGVDTYVNDFTKIADYANSGRKNYLLGEELVALTPLDEEYQDISMLTNGLLGLPSNYHCGQLLSTATPALKIRIPYKEGMKQLRVWMTNNKLFHIILPKKIILSINGKEIGEALPEFDPMRPERAIVKFDIPEEAKDSFLLTIERDTEERTMAIEEIEAF